MSTRSDFSIPDLLRKKEKGQALSKEEIEHFVRFVTEVERNTDAGNAADLQIQEEQIVDMLKAIHEKHLNDEETTYLTQAMKGSGLVLSWPKWKEPLVDKHSTGGVGDKTSLVLTPVLAACNLKVPMISGRRLAHTGGTLDKLESIPGFRVEQTPEQMKHILEKVGCCIVSQTEDIVPADKILYRLRDKSKTVDEKGLITGSIISKKAAESVDALVLDVKYGKGTFCKTIEYAKDLAIQMVKAGNGNKTKTTALLTDMNSPLGYQIGNALEVAEAIQCLHGNGPDDLTVLVKNLGAQLLLSVGKVTCLDEAEELIDTKLKDGSAIAKFNAMIIEQGVNKEMADALCGKENKEYNKILEILKKKSKHKIDLKATTTGHVNGIDALLCGEVARALGADDEHEVGLTLAVRVGDRIEKGKTWVTVHYNQDLRTDVKEKLENAIDIIPGEIQYVTLYTRKKGCVELH